MIFDINVEIRVVIESDKEPRKVATAIVDKITSENLEGILGSGYKVVHKIIHPYHVR